jgi:4-amino-4-deoxychorismate lyase
LQYGDGLFETMRLHEGEVALWPLHLTRLRHGAGRLGLALDEGLLLATLARAKAAARDGSATLKLTLTRGDTVRGMAIR